MAETRFPCESDWQAGFAAGVRQTARQAVNLLCAINSELPISGRRAIFPSVKKSLGALLDIHDDAVTSLREWVDCKRGKPSFREILFKLIFDFAEQPDRDAVKAKTFEIAGLDPDRAEYTAEEFARIEAATDHAIAHCRVEQLEALLLASTEEAIRAALRARHPRDNA